METPDIVNTNEQCDSPVYVERSPVASPVFVSKNTDTDTDKVVSSQVTDKLILPALNMTLLSNDTNVDDTKNKDKHNDKDKDVLLHSSSPSSSSTPTSPDTSSSATPSDPTLAPNNATSVEMVTIVIKDLKYCHEEFLKQVKENNVSISPETIMRLLRIAMVIVEETKEPGNKKKEFVVSLLKEVVMTNKTMLTEHKLEALNLITGNIVSDSIDFIIDASRGKLNINKVEKIAEEVAKTCFSRCFAWFSKKN